MIHLDPMSVEAFEKFKIESQLAFATQLAEVEMIPFDEALKNASEQFARLAPQGTEIRDQLFF